MASLREFIARMRQRAKERKRRDEVLAHLHRLNEASREPPKDRTMGEFLARMGQEKSKKVEYDHSVKCFAIAEEHYNLQQSWGNRTTHVLYVDEDVLWPLLHDLTSGGSCQLASVPCAEIFDDFSFADKYGLQNDYGRISSATGTLSGSISSEGGKWHFDLTASTPHLLSERRYDRACTRAVHRDAIKSAVQEMRRPVDSPEVANNTVDSDGE